MENLGDIAIHVVFNNNLTRTVTVDPFDAVRQLKSQPSAWMATWQHTMFEVLH